MNIAVSAPRLTEPLVKLIELAQRIIPRDGRLYFGDEIERLRPELEASRKRLVDGGNPIDAAPGLLLDLLQYLEQTRREFNRAREADTTRSVRGMLDVVRSILADAMNVEARRPTP